MLQTYDPRNQALLININGKLLPRGQAGISPFDSAVQGGDAVWEGLRVYEGKIFRLAQDLDRLRSSATALAFAEIPSHESIRDEKQISRLPVTCRSAHAECQEHAVDRVRNPTRRQLQVGNKSPQILR